MKEHSKGKSDKFVVEPSALVGGGGIFLCFWKRKEHFSLSFKVLADASEREFIAVNHLCCTSAI